DGVAGGAGDLVDDDPLLAGDLVQQRGLAHVRAADQGDPARTAHGGAEGLRGRLRQRLEDLVQHVAGAAAVQGGHRVGLAEAEGPQVGGVGLAARAVHLVGAQHDRLARLAQQPDDGLVGVGGADLGDHHEHHGVRGLDGVLRLSGDGGVDAEDVLLPAAGVDDLEAAAGPLGLVGDPVPGDTGLVLDDGLAAADDAVHEGRLADIGAANDGEYGERAVSGGLDGALHVLEVEALLRGELHELRVLGVAERPVVVLGRALVGVRAAGVDVAVPEGRPSCLIVVFGGAPGHGHATAQGRSAPGEAPRVLQVRGELLLYAFGGRVQRLAGAPSAAVAGL